MPAWFHWDGDAILLFSKPDAQKVRNLRANSRVMVAVGDPGLEFDVELIEGIGTLAPVAKLPVLPMGFATKYAELAARAGISLAVYATVYSQRISIQPTRWLGYGGSGW